ncbi:colgalt1 [Symbiodinium sp. CCMP2592]|nr:colgalt1 [Symbiodinium sp. CCMP2592]
MLVEIVPPLKGGECGGSLLWHHDCGMAGAAVPVLCCSLLRRDDRRRRMVEALRAAKLTGEFLDAVDGRELQASAAAVPIYGGWDWSNDDWDQEMEPTQENQLRDRGWAQPSLPVPVLRRLAPFYNRPMRWGEVACALTHRRAWLRALEMGPGPTLILEDDALPAARAGPLLSEVLGELPEEWDVCFLAPTELLGGDMEGLVSRVSAMCYGTNAYLCSQQGAARLLRATEGKDIIPVDELMPALALPNGHPRRDVAALLAGAPRLRLYRLRPGTNLILPAMQSWDSDTEVSLPITAETSNARPACGICGGRQAADHPPGEACIVVRGISSDPLLAAMRRKGFCTMPPLHPELPYQVSSEVDAISAAVRAGRAEQATEWLAPIHEARLRHDVKLPLTAAVVQLLNSVIQEYGWLFRAFVGDTARLIELGAIVAFPGAPPQPWHSDVDFDDEERAEIIQAFVALQDISETHGPTQVLVGSHTRSFHRSWPEARPDPDELERESLTLEAGALAIMAGHAYHRGAGNMSAVPRRLLHFAFMSAGPAPVGFTYHLVNELVQSPVMLDQFPLDLGLSCSFPKLEGTSFATRIQIQCTSSLPILREPCRASSVDADGDLDLSPAPSETSPRICVEMEIRLRHPGGTWQTSDVETSTTLPAGLSLWACDVRLADVLLARPKLAKGRVVLDLGCGCALPSIAAARVAKHVFAADAEDAVLRNAAVNLRRNGAGAVLLRHWQGGSLSEFSWRRKDVRNLRRVALLLCSDPLRSEGSAECFMQTLLTISRWFRTPARFQLGRCWGAKLLMAVELRRYFCMATLREEVLELPRFIALCRRRGFSCRRLAAASLPTHLAVPRPRNVAIFSVRLGRSAIAQRKRRRSRRA